MFRAISMITVTTIMTGCASTIESFYNRQVVEDTLVTADTKEKQLGTLAVTAQRRIIVANLKTGNFCSEPPPEAADSITTALAAALKANIAQDKHASAEFASNFARHLNQLYKRSHTVQMFRDASFHLCVNAVNSANGERGVYESYKNDVTNIVQILLPSLDKEIGLYYETEKTKSENPPSISQETIICDSSASIGAKSGSDDKQLSSTINCRPLLHVMENTKAEDSNKE